MATFKIEIEIKRKDGTCAVKILLTHNRELRRLPTGIYLSKEDLTKSGKIKNQAILDQLEDIIRSYRNKANQRSSALADMPMENLVDYLCQKEVKNIDFIEVFKDYIADNKNKKGIRNYSSALNSLIKFIGRDTMDISEMTVPFLEKYVRSLDGSRTPSLYTGCLKCIHEWAKLKYNNEDIGLILIPYAPFSRFKVPKQNVAAKRAINATSIRKIIDLPYKPEGTNRNNLFNFSKDMFILSFALMGINSVDLFEAKDYKDGKLTYFRTKTKDRRSDQAMTVIEIPKHIRILFEKYRDTTDKRVFIFYQMYADASNFNSAINRGLKLIGEHIGSPGLEFYAARHSWATIARNDLAIDKNTINDALIHADKSMTATDLYITKDFTAINNANKKVLDYIYQK